MMEEATRVTTDLSTATAFINPEIEQIYSRRKG